MLRAWTAVLAQALVAALRRRMQADLAERFRVGGFAVVGVDGSRLELPRAASNQAHFAPAPKSKSKSRRHRASARGATAAAHAKRANSPQMWLTVM